MLRSIEAILTTTGERPLGYYPRGASVDTQALAAEEGGFLYDSSTNNEDLPHFVQAGGKKFLTIPYSLDCNDFRYWRNIVEPDQFFRYLKATFDQLYEEAQHAPKMMSVGPPLPLLRPPRKDQGRGAVHSLCQELPRCLVRPAGRHRPLVVGEVRLTGPLNMNGASDRMRSRSEARATRRDP